MSYSIHFLLEVFQLTVSNIICWTVNAEHSQDDILDWGKDLNSFESTLKRGFDKVGGHGLKLNKLKCHIAVKQLLHLGCIILSESFKPDPFYSLNIDDKVGICDPEKKIGNKNVIEDFSAPRSYIVKTKNDKNLSQNCTHLPLTKTKKSNVFRETILNLRTKSQ